MYKHLIYSIVTILSSFKLSSFWFKNKWNNSKIYFSITESQGWWCRRSCLNIQWCSWKQFMWCLTFWHNVMDCNWTWYTSRRQTNNDVCDNSSDVLHGMFSVLLKRHIWKRIAISPLHEVPLKKRQERKRHANTTRSKNKKEFSNFIYISKVLLACICTKRSFLDDVNSLWMLLIGELSLNQVAFLIR
jgi:hypothetical protein